MVVLIDGKGRRVRTGRYARRLYVPRRNKLGIFNYLMKKETESSNYYFGLEDKFRFDPKLKLLMQSFLTMVVYSKDILNKPYEVMPSTKEVLFQFWQRYITFRHQDEVNDSMYDLEKLIRIGLKDVLQQRGIYSVFRKGDVEAIAGLEDHLYEQGLDSYGKPNESRLKVAETMGPYKLIKMLSRHKVLDLPDISQDKRENLQGLILRNTAFREDYPFCTAAKRAGFEIPPIYAAAIEVDFLRWIESDTAQEALDKSAEGVEIGVEEERSIKMYIATMHHFRRLFDDPSGNRLLFWLKDLFSVFS